MSAPFALQVTVELGDRRRTLGPVELAAALGMPGLPGRLAALVLASPKRTAIHSLVHNSPAASARFGKEGDIQGEEGQRSPTDLDESRKEKIDIPLPHSFSSGREVERGKEGCRGGAERDGGFAEAVDTLADLLAGELDDARSLRLFRRVVREVPLRKVGWALDIALDLPDKDIRRSRGAYFTTMIKPHLWPRRTRPNS